MKKLITFVLIALIAFPSLVWGGDIFLPSYSSATTGGLANTSVLGTSNEVEVSYEGDNVIVGLPDTPVIANTVNTANGFYLNGTNGHIWMNFGILTFTASGAGGMQFTQDTANKSIHLQGAQSTTIDSGTPSILMTLQATADNAGIDKGLYLTRTWNGSGTAGDDVIRSDITNTAQGSGAYRHLVFGDDDRGEVFSVDQTGAVWQRELMLGELETHDDSIVLTDLGPVYQDLIGLTNGVSGNGMLLDSSGVSNITTPYDGQFFAVATICASGDSDFGANDEIHGHFRINGVGDEDKCGFVRDNMNNDSTGCMPATCALPLTAGDFVSFVFNSTDTTAGIGDLTIRNFNMVLKQ